MHSVKPHICFVAPNAYAAISGRHDLSHIGGAEVQQAMLAKGLVQCGHEVDIITLDHGQPHVECYDGVRTLRMCKPNAGYPGLKFLHPRLTSLWSALSRSNAEVYYQRTTGVETGQVAIWCHFHKRPFLFAVANDTNCDPRLPDLKRVHERWLYRWGLRHTARVICQTQSQAAAMRDHFDRDSIVIPNGARDPLNGTPPTKLLSSGPTRRILWVGRFGSKKRLEWLLTLAEHCQDLAFDVAGDGNHDDPYVTGLKTRAQHIPNVFLHGRVPHGQMGEFYDRADLLVSTSHVEGFPNTFLEAWSRGLPTVSTFDPDNVIQNNTLGLVAHSLKQLKEEVEFLFRTPNQWLTCSRRARAYFLNNHSITTTVQSLSSLLCSLAPGQVNHGDDVPVSTNAPAVHAPTAGRGRPS
ncbi:MAG: glycosyltransferase family 4 protein [Planctomycetota bacterium]